MGNAKRSEVIRECGARWNRMTVTQKKKYVKISQEDKDRYAREMENYTPQTPVDEPKLKRRKKRPRCTKTSIDNIHGLCFLSSKNVSQRFEKQKDVLQHISTLWRNASDKAKSRFKKEADTDRARYRREMANYTPPPR